MKKFAFLIIFLVFLIDLGDAQIGHNIGGGGESITIVQTWHFAKLAPARIIPNNSFSKPVQSTVPIPTLGFIKPPREDSDILAGPSGGLPS